MILHIFLDSAFLGPLPKDIITLAFSVSTEGKTADITTRAIADQSRRKEYKDKGLSGIESSDEDEDVEEKSFLLSSTLHFPLKDDISKTSTVEIDATAYTMEGIALPLGRGETTVSTVEHGSPKEVILAPSSKPNDKQNSIIKKIKKAHVIRKVTLAAFYYKFPMDISDFKQNDGMTATGRQQQFMKEYSFLQNRRMRWGDAKPSTWNSSSEHLLNEDPAVLVNRDLSAVTNKKGGIHKQKRSAEVPLRKKKMKEKPKLRKTCMSVFYGGINWPECQGKGEDKLLLKLHLADQKRLQLLQEAAEKTRKRNRAKEAKIANIKANHSASADRYERRRLEKLLEEKEKTLRALKAELAYQGKGSFGIFKNRRHEKSKTKPQSAVASGKSNGSNRNTPVVNTRMKQRNQRARDKKSKGSVLIGSRKQSAASPKSSKTSLPSAMSVPEATSSEFLSDDSDLSDLSEVKKPNLEHIEQSKSPTAIQLIRDLKLAHDEIVRKGETMQECLEDNALNRIIQKYSCTEEKSGNASQCSSSSDKSISCDSSIQSRDSLSPNDENDSPTNGVFESVNEALTTLEDCVNSDAFARASKSIDDQDLLAQLEAFQSRLKKLQLKAK